MAVTFTEHEVRSGLEGRRRLSAFVQQIVHRHLEGIRKINLSYIFCTDDYLLDINIRYLNHNTLTDIITFDLSDTETEVAGEIYISVDRVNENAKKFGVAYNEELHRVIFHGALHLCGFKDKTKADAEEMRNQENVCLADYQKQKK